MTTGERVKLIRKELKLTLEKFGKGVGAKPSSISDIESGRNSLTELMAKAICREYNVNYPYLMYGEGEMFSDFKNDLLDEICRVYHCDEIDRKVIERYLKLTAAERDTLRTCIQTIFRA